MTRKMIAFVLTLAIVAALFPGTANVVKADGGYGIEQSVAMIKGQIDQYQASGDVQSAFAGDLKYRLDIIQTLATTGATVQMAAYAEDFLLHIHDPSVLAQHYYAYG